MFTYGLVMQERINDDHWAPNNIARAVLVIRTRATEHVKVVVATALGTNVEHMREAKLNLASVSIGVVRVVKVYHDVRPPVAKQVERGQTVWHVPRLMCGVVNQPPACRMRKSIFDAHNDDVVFHCQCCECIV